MLFLMQIIAGTPGVVKAIIEEHIVLGRDLELFNFGNSDMLNILNMRYQYIERDAKNMGVVAIQMLIDRFNDNSLPRREYSINPKVIVKNPV